MEEEGSDEGGGVDLHVGAGGQEGGGKRGEKYRRMESGRVGDHIEITNDCSWTRSVLACNSNYYWGRRKQFGYVSSSVVCKCGNILGKRVLLRGPGPLLTTPKLCFNF